MWLDALLAYLHYTAIFILFGFVSVQLVLLRGELGASSIRSLARADILAFIGAMLALVTGFMRLAWGAKGAEFYMSSWAFYVKIGLFFTIAAVTVGPTLTYINWKRMLDRDMAYKVPEAERKRIWRFKMIEVHLAAMIPVFAVIMARGLGR